MKIYAEDAKGKEIKILNWIWKERRKYENEIKCLLHLIGNSIIGKLFKIQFYITV